MFILCFNTVFADVSTAVFFKIFSVIFRDAAFTPTEYFKRYCELQYSKDNIEVFQNFQFVI